MEYYGIFREISRELLGLGNDLNKRFNYVENLYNVCVCVCVCFSIKFARNEKMSKIG